MSRSFWERTRALLALSATCKQMREAVLMEAWGYYAICSVRHELQTEAGFLSGYKILLKNPRLAAYVRYCTLFARMHMEYPDMV